MGLSILVIIVALATLIFTYFFLRLNNPIWPPPGIPLPAMLLPGLAAVLVVASGAPLSWAEDRIRRDDVRGLALGLAGTFLLGLVALAMMVVDFRRFDFTPATNAYGPLVFVIGTITGVIVVAGLGMMALTLFHAWQGGLSARRHLWVSNTALYWRFVIVAWLAIFATLYLSPYVL
jgi:cytochrome c oxidase subunit I+III